MYTDGSWRAKVGLIIPAPNTVAEPWLAKVAPSGVTFHTARMPLGNHGVGDMDDAVPGAVASLQAAVVDALLYGCTSSGMQKGLEFEQRFRDNLAQQTGIPVVTAALSVVETLREVGARRISVLSPYPHEMEEVEQRFLQAAGFTVENIHSLCLGGPDLATPGPDQIYRAARQAFRASSDTLFISCLNFRASESVAALESDLGVPVVTAMTASLRQTLKAVGVAPVVPGYGLVLTGELRGK